MKVKGNLQVSGTLEGIRVTDGATTVQKASGIQFYSGDFKVTGAGPIPEVSLRGITFTDGSESVPSTYLSFNSADFYLDRDSQGRPKVNIRGQDYVPFEQEIGALTKSWLIPNAPYPMVVEEAFGIVKSGAAEVGFYIIAGATPHLAGTVIPNLDMFYITADGNRKFPTSGGALSTNDSLMLSVYKTSLVKNLRIGVKLRRV